MKHSYALLLPDGRPLSGLDPSKEYAEFRMGEGDREALEQLQLQLQALTAHLKGVARVEIEPGYTTEGVPKATATISLLGTKTKARDERAKKRHQEAVRGLATHASNPCPRGPGGRR